jgi:hypothetical protein
LHNDFGHSRQVHYRWADTALDRRTTGASHSALYKSRAGPGSDKILVDEDVA